MWHSVAEGKSELGFFHHQLHSDSFIDWELTYQLNITLIGVNVMRYKLLCQNRVLTHCIIPVKNSRCALIRLEKSTSIEEIKATIWLHVAGTKAYIV